MGGFVKKNKNIFILSACILLHTVVLYGICDFSKTIETYGDELLYYSIARSLFYGNGITVHSVPVSFQNLAYCYFLVPFFYISNNILRMHMITLANAFLMSLSIIPVWFLCKELKLKKHYTWYVIILMMVCPDMFTAGTLMSENLYWVLSLTALYFCVRAILSGKKIDSCVAAFCCYLAYFCKEVGVCFALAYLAFCILTPLVDGMLSSYDIQAEERCAFKRVKYSYKKYWENKTWMNLLVFMIVYGLCYFFFKNVFFKEVGSFYSDVIDFSFISDSYSIFYMIYGFFYFILASSLALMIYPVLYPIAYYTKIGQITQKIYFFLMILFIGTIFVIVLTITVNEDLGKMIPRIHLRYMSPMTGLFLPVFFKSISDIEADITYIKNRRGMVFICSLFLISCILVYKGIFGDCATENAGLSLSRYLTIHIANLRINENESVIFYLGAIITNIGIGILLILWNWVEYFKKKYFSIVLFFSFMALSSVNFTMGVINLYQSYGADDQKIIEMNRINSYFKNHRLEEKNVMYVSEHWWTKNAKIYDTYFDGVNAFEISFEELIQKLSQSEKEYLSISEMDFFEIIWRMPYQIDTIDYFISSEELFDLDAVIDGIECVPEISGENFTVYKNVNNSKIALSADKFVEINFGTERYNAPLFVQDGISDCEGDYSWTDGNKMQVRAFTSSTVKSLNVHFYLAGIFNGQQEVVVYQGENIIFDEAISGVNEFEFVLSPVNGDCSFQVYFPGAVSPHGLDMSTDERKLAISLKKIAFEKSE